MENMLRPLIDYICQLPEEKRIEVIQQIVDELNETTLLSNFINKK
jgi:hypothetical protein